VSRLGATSYFDGLIKKKKDCRAMFEGITNNLNEQQAQLRMRLNSLQYRENELLKSCALLIKKKDKARARVYACEIVEINKVLKVLQQSELIVEALRLRIGTAKELGDTGLTLKPLADALIKVKRQLQAFVPEVARELDFATSTLTSVLSLSAPDPNNTDFVSSLTSDSVEAILREAAEQADKKLKENLDNINEMEFSHIVDYVRRNGIEAIGSVVDTLQETSAPIDGVVSQSSVDAVDGAVYVKFTEGENDATQKIYEYIKRNKGTMDILKCCRELDVQREAVIASLKRLEKQGKIRLDHSLLVSE
jgi:division protein CdvB (Snf7/Vps24/ESCRT-III family)